MKWFDINCFVGRWTTEGYHTVDADSLAQEMRRLRVDAALVRHTWGWLYDPREGNAALLREIAGHPEWRPCLAATPLPEDMGALDRFVAFMSESGAPAVTLYPSSQGFTLTHWGAGDLLDSLEAARIPVLLEYQETNWRDLEELITGWPALPVVLTRTGYRILRNLLPLLRAHDNLHVDTAYLGDNLALEYLANQVGAERILFGTGTPRVDGAGALARISMSTLSDDKKQQIAAGNAERLLAAVPSPALAGGRSI